MKKFAKKSILRILTLALAVCMLTALALPAAALEPANGFDEVKYGVFKFNWLYQGENYARGTAFLINDDTIVTAGHNVAFSDLYLKAMGIVGVDAQRFKEDMSYSVTVERDMTVEAELINYSESMDFAILKLKQTIPTRKYLTLRDSKTVKAPESVYSIGFPAVYDNQKTDNAYTVDEVMVKSGIITKSQGLAEYMTTDGYAFKGDALFTDCELSGGDSGGPMVDSNGYVVGVSISGSTIASEDVKYYRASAIDQVMRACDNLGITYYTNDNIIDDNVVAQVTPAPTAEPEVTPAPTAEPEATPAPAVEEKEEGLSPVIMVVAAVAVVAVLAIVVIVMKKGKKEEPAPAATVSNNSASTGGFAPATHTIATGAGETTVLTQSAGETTLLSRNVNGGVLTRKRTGESIKINTESFVIGRERKTVNYCLSDNSSISRNHAKIVIRGGAAYLVDLNAPNGTFVNNVKLTPNKEVALKTGDKITLADEDFEYKQ